MNLKKIKDSTPFDNHKLVEDLYIYGSVTVDIPEGRDPEEFATECEETIHDTWGEPDVNYDYGDLELKHTIEGNKLTIINALEQ